ncbi:piggyBac transposable element-derived protein 4-like protein [Lates japonicus]|uniref:PiggyBac transposable element-derived protein 4-like protein n=1 Tax=Lates japonicus TaxID=270547 RepID=A0AAD3MB41_LATJO|nr:piggyBac transposable element-derived protein 4-like protein [Lates japonicus]
MRRNKPELPPKLLEVRQQASLSIFAFSSTHTAVSYIPKWGKNVTAHREPAISDELHQKPMIIMDYNRRNTKVVSIILVVRTYSCHHKTQRWPLNSAFVLWMRVDPLWKDGATHK